MHRHYDPHVYDNLPEEEIAWHNLKFNKHKLAPLGAIICHHALEDHIGICLLHKHFELRSNEILVRIESEAGFRIEPRRLEQGDKLFTYVWKLTFGSQQHWQLWPLEFMKCMPTSLCPRSEGDLT